MRSLAACCNPSWLLILLLTVSCGGQNNAADDDGSILGTDAGPDAGPNWDAFFADDPPAQYCGPDDGSWTPPEPPGGTAECPSDKNREGCPCDKLGETAPCWPGKRVHRDRGICKDGTTTCVSHGEFDYGWGPCEGYVLPKPGATRGAEACGCFSAGRWNIENTTPCFITYDAKQTYYATSTPTDGKCAAVVGAPPPAAPDQPWSPNTLNVDCAGQFELCYTLKAGDFDKPSASDCVLATACIETWYPDKGVEQTLPLLPAWNTKDTTCATQFAKSGGYGEMSVLGLSIECEAIDDNGDPLVFHRVAYCALHCNQPENQDLAECKNCGNGTSGIF